MEMSTTEKLYYEDTSLLEPHSTWIRKRHVHACRRFSRGGKLLKRGGCNGSLSMESSNSEMSITCANVIWQPQTQGGPQILEVEEQWDSADAIPGPCLVAGTVLFRKGNDDLALQIDVNYGTSESRDGRPIVVEDLFHRPSFFGCCTYGR